MLLITDIHVRSFSGRGILPYIHSIAKLRCAILRDYPYFEEANPHTEADNLRKIASSLESVGVLIFDNTTLVGVSFGHPLELEPSEYHLPFQDKGWDISSCYFFGESTLLKPYRGRGIGHHFFDVRESFVEQLNCEKAHKGAPFTKIGFSAPIAIESQEGRPSDFVPMHDFWRKRGYVHHPEMHVSIKKKRVRPYSEEMTISFWIKNVS